MGGNHIDNGRVLRFGFVFESCLFAYAVVQIVVEIVDPYSNIHYTVQGLPVVLVSWWGWNSNVPSRPTWPFKVRLWVRTKEEMKTSMRKKKEIIDEKGVSGHIQRSTCQEKISLRVQGSTYPMLKARSRLSDDRVQSAIL